MKGSIVILINVAIMKKDDKKLTICTLPSFRILCRKIVFWLWHRFLTVFGTGSDRTMKWIAQLWTTRNRRGVKNGHKTEGRARSELKWEYEMRKKSKKQEKGRSRAKLTRVSKLQRNKKKVKGNEEARKSRRVKWTKERQNERRAIEATEVWID